MTAPGPVAQSAQVVAASVGARFRLVSEPADRPPCGSVIWAHAFGEEMNKTRRMCGRMARLLAAAGWRVIQKDLQGCGDSSGEFRDASWTTWVDDLRTELAAAPADHPVWLWCVRAGALLAPALIADRHDLNLLLWQPVSSGALHLQQFLRLQAGARITGSAKAGGEATPAQALRAGATVEVGGYELPAAVAGGLERANFDVPAGFSGRIVWLDVSPDEPPTPSPQALRTTERLRAGGLAVELEAVGGPAFWQTQEIEDCDALLQRTLALIGRPTVPAAALPR